MNRQHPTTTFLGASCALIVTLISVSIAAAADTKPSKRPNVVWIMMDDCRADALGCYGQPWAKTPHMDAVAERGVRFGVAIVQNPVF